METSVSGMACRCGTCDDCRAARTARKDARHLNILQPDLELVAVPGDESFKVWSHGYPYRTVRWHFHPEYEIQVITSTTGKYFVGDFIGSFEPGNLVMTGPNLPHNWVSNVPHGERVDERCLILQFDAEVIAQAIKAFPELKRVECLLDASRWGVLFTPKTGAAAEPIMREMLGAQGMRRITLFLALLDLLVQGTEQVKLASAAYRADPSHYAETRINHVLSLYRQEPVAGVARNGVGGASRPKRQRLFAIFPPSYRRALRAVCEPSAHQSGVPIADVGRTEHHRYLLSGGFQQSLEFQPPVSVAEGDVAVAMARVSAAQRCQRD